MGVSSLEGLYSTQEEADTRLVLHAIMLSRDHPRIIIRCDDTKVLVLSVYYWSRGALADEVYMHVEHSGRLQTTQPTSGGAVTADSSSCANCFEPSRPQQIGGQIYRFWGMPAMRTRWMAGAAAHKRG